MFINIIFWEGILIGRVDFLFRARFTSFHTHASIFFSFFVLFHSFCFLARVFLKTLSHVFLISCSHKAHTEWYLLSRAMI